MWFGGHDPVAVLVAKDAALRNVRARGEDTSAATVHSSEKVFADDLNDHNERGRHIGAIVQDLRSSAPYLPFKPRTGATHVLYCERSIPRYPAGLGR